MVANRLQELEKVKNVQFEEFTTPCENSEDKIKFSPVNDGKAVYLDDLDQYKIKFNVFNRGFIGHLEVFLDMDDGTCISRFTYKRGQNKDAHYIREDLSVLYPKKINMQLAKYAGKLAAEYYAVNSNKKLNEWMKISKPLEIARTI